VVTIRIKVKYLDDIKEGYKSEVTLQDLNSFLMWLFHSTAESDMTACKARLARLIWFDVLKTVKMRIFQSK
jgi:hypothetical protein